MGAPKSNLRISLTSENHGSTLITFSNSPEVIENVESTIISFCSNKNLNIKQTGIGFEMKFDVYMKLMSALSNILR